MQRILYAVYAAFFPAMFAALACAANTWLEMRLNMGHLLFGIWLLMFCVFRFFHKYPGPKTVAAWVIACVGLGLWLHGLQTMRILPAALIREGLHMPWLDFASLNLFLGIFIIIVPFFLLSRSSKKLPV